MAISGEEVPPPAACAVERHVDRPWASSRRGEELERDAVRVAEAHARAVGRVLDATVVDAELVEPARPTSRARSRSAHAEGDVVEADPELAELLGRRRRLVLVQPDERAVAEQVDGVVQVGVGVLVDHGFGVEERLVPGDADRRGRAP